MAVLTRLFASRRRKNQQQIACRAAQVIDHVLFDVGVDSFFNGTLLLDKHFRLRFFGGAPQSGPDVLASVPVRELAEARAFRALVDEAAGADGPFDLHIGGVVDGLMRELNAQCAQLRALP
jgi:hypothetical protein